MGKLPEPKIGIFWFYKGRLHYHGEPASNLSPVEGYADVDVSHYDHWESLKRKHPEFRAYEYEDIPRGRIVMKLDGSEYLVYTNQRLVEDPDFRLEVLEQFELPPNETKFLQDAHYEDPSQIEWDS